MAKRFSMKKPAAKARPRTGKAPKAMFGRRGTKKKAAARKAGARSQPLPGMGQVRNARLDHLCESIGEDREASNAAKGREAGSKMAALKVMQESDTQVYRHAGVELARVPGAENLRIRLTKAQGDADASDLVGSDDLAEAADMDAATGGVEA